MIIDIVLGYAYGRGGLEDVLTKVSKGLVNKGHRVRIFQAYRPEYKEWIETLPEIYFYRDNGNLETDNNFDLSLGYRDCIDKLGVPDIILATHAPMFSIVCKNAIAYLGQQQPKIISWIHGDPEYYGGTNCLNYNCAHLAISSSIKNKIDKHINNDSEIYYIGNPVDINSKNNVKINRKKMKYLYIGRLNNQEKRIDILFNSLKKMKFNWELKIIGNGPDIVELKRLAIKLNINKNINWLGWKEDPWNFVDDVTCMISTSDYEGFGLVMVEALSRGIPVVASKTSGAKDIVIDDENGWLFNIGDCDQLTGILTDIKKGYKVLPSKEKCKESIKKFDTEYVVNIIEEIILNVYKN